MNCPTVSDFVEERMNLVLTQYRESPKLLAVIRRDLEEMAAAMDAACAIPSRFDILNAVGDQLTILGRQLGWPREHCICVPVPVFGFSCGTSSPNRPIVGLCEGGVWGDCFEAGNGTISLDDDEVYRGYLLARRYQVRKLWDIDSLQAAARDIWGADVVVSSLGAGRVAVRPRRPLSSLELIQVPLAFRVLPLAPGITPYISYSTSKVFGFGAGWGGLCDRSSWLCPEEVSPYTCA